MNPIEIGKAIDTYGIAIITAIILVLVVWLVRYLIIHIMGMLKNELKVLHSDSVKNADLNNQTVTLQKETIILQKELGKDLKAHNGHSKKAWVKAINSLGLIADRMNGGSPVSLAIKKELELYKSRGIIDRREIEKEVEKDRRK